MLDIVSSLWWLQHWVVGTQQMWGETWWMSPLSRLALLSLCVVSAWNPVRASWKCQMRFWGGLRLIKFMAYSIQQCRYRQSGAALGSQRWERPLRLWSKCFWSSSPVNNDRHWFKLALVQYYSCSVGRPGQVRHCFDSSFSPKREFNLHPSPPIQKEQIRTPLVLLPFISLP